MSDFFKMQAMLNVLTARRPAMRIGCRRDERDTWKYDRKRFQRTRWYQNSSLKVKIMMRRLYASTEVPNV